MEVRHRLESAGKGPDLRPHGLVLRPKPNVAAAVLPRLARRPGDPPGLTSVPVAYRSLAAAAATGRRALVDVMEGSADSVLLGQPRPDRATAARDVVHQLDMPHLRQRGVRGA